MKSTAEQKPFLALKCLPFFEARLWWKFASRTKVLVSIITSDHFVSQKKFSTPVPIYDEKNEWKWEEFGRHKHSRSRKKQGSKRASGGNECYLCSIKYTKLDSQPYAPGLNPINDEATTMTYTPNTSIAPANTQATHYRCLPLAHTQPPRPPPRSTSLPHYLQLQKLHLSTAPQYALKGHLGTGSNGMWSAYLVSIWEGGNGLGSQLALPIWRYVLQVSTSEPCIRALALKVALLSCPTYPTIQTRNYTPTSSTNMPMVLFKFLTVTDSDPRRLEIEFLAMYLLATMYISLGHKRMARFWLRKGYRVLRTAMRRFCPRGVDGEGYALPGEMRGVALAFGTLGL